MTTILPRRGTAAQWTTANPVLAMGEEGYETDTTRWKRGDGVTAWNALAYYQPSWSDITAKPAVIAAGADQAAARAAIGAVDNVALMKKLELTPTSVKTVAYTAAANELIPADAGAGGFTVTLPNAPADKSVIAVKKIDSTSNTVIVQRSGTDVINKVGGATSAQIVIPDQTIALQYQASNGVWYVIWHGTPLAALDSRYIQSDGDDISVTRISDSNGNPSIDIAATSGAVNYVRVINSPTSSSPKIAVTGDDANIKLTLAAKGLGQVSLRDGADAISFTTVPRENTVNYLFAEPSVTGAAPKFGVSGPDADISLDLRTKGLGKALVNGEQVVTAPNAKPASATSPGKEGQIRWDSSYIYVCVATNTWMRAPLQAW